MKTECPVCGQPRNNPAEQPGRKVVCKSCRIRYEIRQITTAEEQQETAEFRTQLLTVTLPIVLFGFVVVCGISAEVLDSRRNQPRSDFGDPAVGTLPAQAHSPSQSQPSVAPRQQPRQPTLAERIGMPQNTVTKAEREAAEGTTEAPTATQETRARNLINGGLDKLTVIPVQVAPAASDPPAPAATDRPLPDALTNGTIVDFSDDVMDVLAFTGSRLVKRNLQTQQTEVLYEAPSLAVKTVELGRIAASLGTADGKVIWFQGNGANNVREAVHKHSGRVIATHSNGLMVWSCGDDGAMLGNSYFPNRSIKLELPARPISAHFSSSRSVIVGFEDRRVMIGSGSDFDEWRGFRSATPAQCVSLSDDADYLVAAGGQQAEIRRADTFDLQQVFSSPVAIASVALSRNGDLLAVGGQDGQLIVYSTWSRRVVATHRFESAAVELQFPQFGPSPIAAATASGELFRIELVSAALTGAERVPSRWTPLAAREEARHWNPLSSFMNPEMETAFENAGGVVRDVVVATGRYQRRVQYLQQHGDLVVAFGCGLADVKRVVWFNGTRRKELPIQHTSETQVRLEWSPRGATVPLLLFETSDALIVTVPYELTEASSDTVSNERDDEINFLRPGRTFETLDDNFQLLVLPAQTSITSEIKGRGVVVAQQGSLLPENVRGPIAVMRTNDHQIPSGFPASGQTDFAADQLYLCPVPAVLPAR